MTENNGTQKSRKCYIGFLLSILVLAFVCLLWQFGSSLGLSSSSVILIIFLLGVGALVALCISASGVKYASNYAMEGQGLGITGIILSSVELAIVLFLMIVIALESLSVAFLSKGYNGPEVKYEGFTLKLDKSEKRASCAMAKSWEWSGDPNDNVIDIPEKTTDGIVIDRIGRRAGPRTVFFDILPQEGVEDLFEARGVPEGTEVHFEDLVFTVKISKSVKEVCISGVPDFALRNADGSITHYRTYLYFECSPDHPYFQSVDGVLEVKPDQPSHTGALRISEYVYKDKT